MKSSVIVGPELLEDLKLKAKNAKRGPWRCFETDNNSYNVYSLGDGDCVVYSGHDSEEEIDYGIEDESDADYIAAVSPDVVMALIDCIEFQKHEIERLVEVRDGIVEDGRDTRITKLEKMVDWLASQLEQRIHGCLGCTEYKENCSPERNPCAYKGPDNWRRMAEQAIGEQSCTK